MTVMKSFKRVIALYCKSDQFLTWKKFILRLALSSALVLLMNLAHVNPAMAAGDGEGGGNNKQTPVQVVVQIVLTTIVMKIIEPWVIQL